MIPSPFFWFNLPRVCLFNDLFQLPTLGFCEMLLCFPFHWFVFIIFFLVYFVHSDDTHNSLNWTLSYKVRLNKTHFKLHPTSFNTYQLSLWFILLTDYDCYKLVSLIFHILNILINCQSAWFIITGKHVKIIHQIVHLFLSPYNSSNSCFIYFYSIYIQV